MALTDHTQRQCLTRKQLPCMITTPVASGSRRWRQRTDPPKVEHEIGWRIAAGRPLIALRVGQHKITMSIECPPMALLAPETLANAELTTALKTWG